MNIDMNLSDAKLAWLVGIHVTFVISTVLMTWSDRLMSR